MVNDKPAPANRAKFITLALLLVWVAGIFVFSILKFSKIIA